MATDALILTAARDIHTSIQAIKDQEQVLAKINQDQLIAARKLDDLKKRHMEVERRLLQLSAQKPAEPATPPVPPVPPRVELPSVAEDEPTPVAEVPAPEKEDKPNVGAVPTLQPRRRDRVHSRD